MIYLNSTQSTVTVTLYENCVNTINPFFTWQLFDLGTKQSFVFTTDDYSPVPAYYNQFIFSVVSLTGTNSAYGLTNGTIYSNQGSYEYTVYEMPTQYDLNLNNAIGIVEKGLLQINGTCSPYVVNTTNDSATIFVNKSLD